MNATAAAVSQPALASRASVRAALVRWFYPGSALLLIALTLVGFHHFYLSGRAYPGREITPPIRGLVITHGVIMAAWLVMFLVQPTLVALRNRRMHMTLGRVASVLAIAVVVCGMLIGVNSARVNPPEMQIWGLHPKQFLAVPFFAALLFAAFIGLGVYFRRRPEIHRPMMLVGTFAAMSAAISRIDALSNLYIGTIWQTIFGPFLATQALLGLLLLARCAITRTFDRWLAIGFVSLTIACVLIMQIATTDAWSWFASLLVP